VALLALVTALSYASAVSSGFVWDDHKVIERGHLIGSLGNLPQLFTHDAMFNSDGGRYGRTATVDTYRPLTLATFFFEHALYGVRPAPYHVDSVLLHLAVVLLLYAVAHRLRAPPGVALLSALLFAVHPAISEAVHWVNGRSDPLCTGFFLLALWVWLGPAARWRSPVVALLLAAAALSKESAFLLLPPLVLLLPALGRPLATLWPFGVGAALAMSGRLLALGQAKVGAGAEQARWVLPRLPLIWADATRGLVLPYAELLPSLHERYRTLGGVRALVAVALVAGLLALGVREWRRGRPLLLTGIAAQGFTLAPVAMLTYFVSWNGWGRYLYPSAPLFILGLAMSAHAAVERAPRLRVPLLCASCGFAALCALATFWGGRAWQDERSFAAAQIADFPDLAMGWSELAVVDLESGDAAAAVEHARRATELDPDGPLHWSRLSLALIRQDRRPEAYVAARRALRSDPADLSARQVIAAELLETGREAEAAASLVAIVVEDPGRPGPWKMLEDQVKRRGGGSPFGTALKRLGAEVADPAVAARLAALVPKG
jgi:tetratricopeptide (TPR) repeat protein